MQLPGSMSLGRETPMRLSRRRILGSLLLLGVGCDVPGLLHDDDAATPVDADDDDAAPPGPVTFIDADIAVEQECPDASRWGGACDPDTTSWVELYDSFFAQPEAMAAAAPMEDCEAYLDALFEIRVSGEAWVEAAEWSEVGGPDGLAEEVWAGVGMEFLFDDLSRRPLQVLQGPPLPRFSPDGVPYTEQEVILRDRFAGDVPGLLLLPVGPGPFPAVVALPGHAETAGQHVDNRYGARFPEAGLALLAVSFRAYQQTGDGGPIRPESAASRRFLCEGFSLLGMRAYEATLAARALGAHPLTEGQPLGAIGHSGGSNTSYALVWRKDVPIEAWVFDNSPANFDMDEFQGSYTLDCAVHEELERVSGLMGDLCAMPADWGRPWRRVPYAYAPGVEPVDDECSFWPYPPTPTEPGPGDAGAPGLFIPFFVEALGGG